MNTERIAEALGASEHMPVEEALRRCMSERDRLRWTLVQIDQETEHRRFGDPGYDITHDHIHELIASALNPEPTP